MLSVQWQRIRCTHRAPKLPHLEFSFCFARAFKFNEASAVHNAEFGRKGEVGELGVWVYLCTVILGH